MLEFLERTISFWSLIYKAIGKRIKIARIKQNLTQETVADRIGVTPQHISNVETGNTSVSLPTLIAIANTLQVSMDELLCDTLLASAPVYEREAQMLLKDCAIAMKSGCCSMS